MKKYGEQEGLFCLNKGWRFCETDLTVYTSSNKHEDVYGFAKGGAAKGPAAASFDDKDWEVVELPHDWLVEKDFTEEARATQGYKKRGTGWYRFKFALPEEDRNKQILLEFEGMSCDTKIYVNGMLMKRNYSGYNSFAIDITDMVNYGIVPNMLAIYLDASLWEGWWYEGAGIYRNVWMCKKDQVHIAYQGVFLKPVQKNDKFELQIETTIENTGNEKAKFELRHIFMDQSGKTIATVQDVHEVDAYKSCCINDVMDPGEIEIWDIEHPNLYQVKTIVVKDEKEVDFQINETGFRTIAFDAETGFYLNGKPMKIKGFCNHQDHTGVGVAVPYRVKEYRIKKLKELGANAYRLAHNPDPEILSLCDQYGMMVMEENRLFSSAEENLEVVKGMVKKARNHPSVIMYSALNEEPLQGGMQGHRIAAKIRATILELDDSRPVTGAMNGGYLESAGATTALDIVGINYNPKMYDEFHKKFPKIPLVGSETASAFMVRGEYQTDYEKHMIDDYDSESALWGNKVIEGWKYIADRPFVMGGFVWTGFDYRGEPTPFEWPSMSTYFGTYDSCGFEKNACYLYKTLWKDEPCVHISSPWSGQLTEGQKVRVQVASNLEEVELFLNGKTLGKKAVNAFEQAVFEVAFEQGTLEAVGYKNGEKVITDMQRSAEKACKLQLESAFDEAFKDCGDAIIVNVALKDQNGTVPLAADDMIHFEVTNGTIIGVGNGNPISHEPDVADYRKLFHGLAQVIVKPHQEGDVVIKASTEDGITETIQIPCKKTETIPYIDPVEEVTVDGWKRYYQLFDEMPDVHISRDSNDMNSFEPVIFTDEVQPELSGKLGKYAMFRTEYDFGKKKAGRRIYFPEILGHAFIYLNGEEVARRTDAFGGSVLVDLDECVEGKNELTVIIWNGREDYAEAGICMPVSIV